MKMKAYRQQDSIKLLRSSLNTLPGQNVFRWIIAMVATLMLFPGRNSAEPDQQECAPTRCSWECLSTGSVNNPGALSASSAIICAGGNLQKPSFGTATFNPGSKRQKCVNPCATTYGEPVNITYAQTNWFEPSLPNSISTCGVFSYTAFVKGTDPDCSPTEKKEVGTFTVTVVKVTKGTVPSEICAACSASISAIVCPGGVRTLNWQIESQDSGVSVTLQNSSTLTDANGVGSNTIKANENTGEGNVRIKATDSESGCSVTMSVAIKEFRRGIFQKGNKTVTPSGAFNDSGTVVVYGTASPLGSMVAWDCPITYGPNSKNTSFKIQYVPNDQCYGSINIDDGFSAVVSTTVETYEHAIYKLSFQSRAQVAAAVSSSDPHFSGPLLVKCGSNVGFSSSSITLSTSPSISVDLNQIQPTCNEPGSANYHEPVECHAPGTDLSRTVDVMGLLYYKVEVNPQYGCGGVLPGGYAAYAKASWTITLTQADPNPTGNPVSKCCTP